LRTGLPPGEAGDLAAGEGRHALWLAGRGWRATAVDFSGAGLARGQVQPGAGGVTWVRADVLEWSAAPASVHLVLVAYLHLPERQTRLVLDRAVDWLRPGGRLLVLGHDVQNIDGGVGGPQDPAILHSVERLAPVAARLDVDQLEQVARETPAGTALDTLPGGDDRSGPSAAGGSVPSRDGDGWSGRARGCPPPSADRRRAGAGAGPRRGCGRPLLLLSILGGGVR
ncbi:MAG: class I SAM-dependent methyltransferase, partial [Actinomycetes bacterium]